MLHWIEYSMETAIEPVKMDELYSEFLGDVPSQSQSLTIWNKIISSRLCKLVVILGPRGMHFSKHYLKNKTNNTLLRPLIYILYSILLVFLLFILCKIKMIAYYTKLFCVAFHISWKLIHSVQLNKTSVYHKCHITIIGVFYRRKILLIWNRYTSISLYASFPSSKEKKISKGLLSRTQGLFRF